MQSRPDECGLLLAAIFGRFRSWFVFQAITQNDLGPESEWSFDGVTTAGERMVGISDSSPLELCRRVAGTTLQTHRTCPRCATIKPLVEFPQDRTRAWSRGYRCLVCERARWREKAKRWRARKRDGEGNQ